MKIVQLLPEGGMAVYSDSALISGGRPVFLPEAGAPWEGRMFPAYRVSRLGKNISAKFAHRYIDAFTLVVIAFPSENSTITKEQAKCMDCAVAIGKWLPMDSDEINFSFRNGFFSVSHAGNEIQRAVAAISSISTIKNGDIIIPAVAPLVTFPLDLDSAVIVSAYDERIMAYNIK